MSSAELSQNDFLTTVPEQWRIRRAKNVFQRSLNLSKTGEENLMSVSEYYGVAPRAERISEGENLTRADSLEGYKKCEPGELVMNIMLAWRGAHGFAKESGIVSPAYEVFKVIDPESDSNYLNYLLRTQLYSNLFKQHSTGIMDSRLRLYPESFLALPIILPPLSEQRAIVAFLDRETAQLDALLERKQRLLELLEEQRRAVISRAVTRGLNPDAPLKDSGVPWLGQVPEGWEVMPLKRIGKIRYGLGQPPQEQDGGLPLLRATNIDRGKIVDQGMIFVNADDVPKAKNAFLAEGEILIVRSGAYTGDSAIVPTEYAGAVAGYDMVLSVENGTPSYIAWQLLSDSVQKSQFDLQKMRAAQPHLNAEELSETLLVSPSILEQQAIAAYLESETAKLDALRVKLEQSVDQLKEYRSALITAAVTGQIDVNGEVS